MASYTWNLNLKKPALDDDALITDINNNMDILDAAVNGIQDGLAIVANGNTHVAITSGQFVYVRNHGTLTEGLYVASSNIAANATLSTSNLTADSAGGLNALNSNIASKPNILSYTVNSNSSLSITTDLPKAYLLATYASGSALIKVFVGIGYGAEATRHKLSQLTGTTSEDDISVSVSNSTYGVTIQNNSNSTIIVAVLEIAKR